MAVRLTRPLFNPSFHGTFHSAPNTSILNTDKHPSVMLRGCFSKSGFKHLDSRLYMLHALDFLGSSRFFNGKLVIPTLKLGHFEDHWEDAHCTFDKPTSFQLPLLRSVAVWWFVTTHQKFVPIVLSVLWDCDSDDVWLRASVLGNAAVLTAFGSRQNLSRPIAVHHAERAS